MRILISTIMFGSIIVSFIQFVLHDANNFMEYTQSVYIIVDSVMVAMYFFVMVFNMRDLFQFIANIENHFEGKESCTI